MIWYKKNKDNKHFSWEGGFLWPKKWFAWYPVEVTIEFTNNEAYVWLEYVWYREHSGWTSYYYRANSK